MAKSARLEIHQLNVSAGDSALIINRDLDKVETNIIAARKKKKSLPVVPDDELDYVPYAIYYGVTLVGTVNAALLIDGGVDQFGGDVLRYMEKHGVIDQKKKKQPKLTVLLSHYHDDHQGGLRYMLKRRVEPKKKGDKLTFVDGIFPDAAYLPARDKDADKSVKEKGEQLRDWLEEAWNNDDVSTLAWVYPGGLSKPKGGSPITIDLGEGVDNLEIKVTLLAANQAVYRKDKKTTVYIPPKKSKVFNQNDRCAVAVLEYGSFRYFFGGDIGGDGGSAGGNDKKLAAEPNKPWFSPKYADIESVIGPALEVFFPATQKKTAKAGTAKFPYPGYCTVMKADHHGSNTSNDVYFFGTIRPLLFLISCGVKLDSHGHPTQQVMDRAAIAMWGLRTPDGQKKKPAAVKNTIEQVYITEVAKKTPSRPKSANLGDARVMGCIVVRPVDETVAAVQDATKLGELLSVQVYGDGVFTTIAKDEQKDYQLVAATGDAGYADEYYYPCGPWEHSDAH
jgi:beta-lactamase superfamily II metal-dependent hydrolase